MKIASHISKYQRATAAGLFAALLAFLAVSFGASSVGVVHAGHNSAMGDAQGYTDGWLDGRTVQFFYPKSYFCAEPPHSGADSHCEVGEEAVNPPRPGENIPVLYVMTPIGIEVDQTTLQCPEQGSCINHPTTIDVSRVLGPGTENILLPPHSHIVDVAQGGWWEIEVIGVTDLDVWNQIVAAKDLDTVRELQAQGKGITGDIPSNLYLFFNVQE